MRTAVRRKFETHAGLREQLLATGDEELVEDSPNDKFKLRAVREDLELNEEGAGQPTTARRFYGVKRFRYGTVKVYGSFT